MIIILFTLISNKLHDLSNHHLPGHSQCIIDKSKPQKEKNFSSHWHYNNVVHYFTLCYDLTIVQLNKHCYHPPPGMYR